MNLFIPKTLKVGYQERKDTYSGKLGYVIDYDEKNIRNEGYFELIHHRINSEGSNPKSVNFVELVGYKDGMGIFNYGYWITYLNCKPLYQKETIHLPIAKPEGIDFCHCGGQMKTSKAGNKYCGNICWK